MGYGALFASILEKLEAATLLAAPSCCMIGY